MSIVIPRVVKPPSDDSSSMRGAEDGSAQTPADSLHSMVEGPLPRSRFLLRWAGPAEARYEVTVMSQDLDLLVGPVETEATDLLVPPESLVGFPDGSEVHWTVEAILPGGEPAKLIEITRLAP